MFAAEFDPSWKGLDGEKVGERRARKARERTASRSGTPAGNLSTSRSQSTTGTASAGPTETSSSKSIPLRNKLSSMLRLPLRHSQKRHRSHKKASEQPSEKPVFKIERVPTLLQQKDRKPDDISRTSPFANSFISSDTKSASNRPRRLHISNQEDADRFIQAYDQVKEKIYALQAVQSGMNVPLRAASPISFSPSSEQTNYEESWTSDSQYDDPASLEDCSPSSDMMTSQTALDLANESLTMLDHFVPKRISSKRKDTAVASPQADLGLHTKPSTSSEFVNQHSLQLYGSHVSNRSHESQLYSSGSVQSPQLDLNGNHFIRMIRRMETASPTVILDRMREKWDENLDSVVREELHLEKQLWALVAIENPILNEFSKPAAISTTTSSLLPWSQQRNVIEIDGTLAELYHTLSRHVDSRIVHLMMPDITFETNLPVPTAVTQHHMSKVSPPDAVSDNQCNSISYLNWSLPYTSLSVHHIQASRLATSVPDPQLPPLLTDCLRILKPGGTLGLQIVDAIPDRGTTGPRLATWLEEKFLDNIERGLRCPRPCRMLPQFAAQAGFMAMHSGPVRLIRHHKLPAAADETEGSIASNIASMVLRVLWRHSWGGYVSTNRSDTPSWWWDDDEIVEECLEWKTTWDVGAMLVMKGEQC